MSDLPTAAEAVLVGPRVRRRVDALITRSLRVIKFGWRVVRDFRDDEGLTRSAALSYYTALSFAPLVLLLLTVLGWYDTRAQALLVQEISALVGPQAGELADLVIDSAQESGSTDVGWFGLVALLFSAAAVFGQLQDALNRVWSVEAKPSLGLLSWLVTRIVSMGMVVGVVFLLTVSLAVSTALSFLQKASVDLIGEAWVWEILANLVSLALLATLFAAMFRVLPDVRLRWRDVWLGAGATAALFVVGKWAVGFYLGQRSIGSAYGAAGALLVLLVWVYYASVIFLLGAEITQVVANPTDSASSRPPVGHAELAARHGADS